MTPTHEPRLADFGLSVLFTSYPELFPVLAPSDETRYLGIAPVSDIPFLQTS